MKIQQRRCTVSVSDKAAMLRSAETNMLEAIGLPILAVAFVCAALAGGTAAVHDDARP